MDNLPRPRSTFFFLSLCPSLALSLTLFLPVYLQHLPSQGLKQSRLLHYPHGSSGIFLAALPLRFSGSTRKPLGTRGGTQGGGTDFTGNHFHFCAPARLALGLRVLNWLNCVPPKLICCSPSPHYLSKCPDLKTESLKIELN